VSVAQLRAEYGNRAHIEWDQERECWWVVRPFDGGFLDWGLSVSRIEPDGYVSSEWSHPCCLSGDCYGSYGGFEWSDADWRDALESIADEEITAALDRGAL
jgi:hypothetical protein